MKFWNSGGSPPYSPTLGIIIPALIQCSSGSVAATAAPFSCSGHGWSSCVKPGYMKACCWPPRAARGYMDPPAWCIPSRPPRCRTPTPDWDGLKSWGLDRDPGWPGEETAGGFGWGEGVSEARCATGLPPGLLLWYKPGDAASLSALCSALCARSASMRKFFDLSIVVIIVPRDVSRKHFLL